MAAGLAMTVLVFLSRGDSCITRHHRVVTLLVAGIRTLLAAAWQDAVLPCASPLHPAVLAWLHHAEH